MPRGIGQEHAEKLTNSERVYRLHAVPGRYRQTMAELFVYHSGDMRGRVETLLGSNNLSEFTQVCGS